jgi:hypothetical protein
MEEPATDLCSRICLTPARNEAWIIKPFLAAAKSWADRVIVADQGSTDGTLEQLQKTAGVETVINDLKTFDEVHRQRLLINSARRIHGKRILVALDADEALSSNAAASKEWEQIENAAPGTVLRFPWVNILPGYETGWVTPQPLACGFVDDGSEHVGNSRIHNPRLPCPADSPVLVLKEIVVLHFQYVLWDRMRSKQRWYQAWERLNYPEKGALQIFRQYNHMHGGWSDAEIQPLKREWLGDFDSGGIDFRSLRSEPTTWWDKEVAQLLGKHGTEKFRQIALWDKNWKQVAKDSGLNCSDMSDPRSFMEKVVHQLLVATQKRRANLSVRGLEWFLRRAGW